MKIFNERVLLLLVRVLLSFHLKLDMISKVVRDLEVPFLNSKRRILFSIVGWFNVLLKNYFIHY